MADHTSRNNINRIIARTRVYSPPFIFDRLNEVINLPNSSVKDIARIIQEDQALTARILRLANSPLFGYFSKVETISHAVTIIGTQQLRDLALAASVTGIFRGIPEELMNMDTFWRHSVACGIVSRNLAIYLRTDNFERLFVAGILHDIGQVLMCAAIPEVLTLILEESLASEELFQRTEKAHLGFDHAELGGAFLTEWKLPPSIVDPVAFHHAPRSARSYPLEAAIVHLANIVCQAMQWSARGGLSYVPPLDAASWNRLGLPPHVLSMIVKQSETQLEATLSILGDEP